MVTVLVGEASGEVAVTAATACGTSEPAVLSVTPFNPYIPLVFLVTGGGYYCEGGAGLPVGLSGSQDEIVYTLYKNGVLQSSITGDGNALSFGNLLEGTYTVMADNGTNTIWMEGSAIVEESTSILVDVTIETNQQEVCEGSSVIITAIAENGGTNPLYTWYLNGETTGVNGPEYTFTPEDSDQIYVVLTSDLGGCVVNNPATSNIISIQTIENLPVSVSIVPDANDVCAGTLVTFSASPVNEGSPNYQWYVNGEQAGTDQASFSYIPEDGDEVQVVMTSSLTCTSNNPSTSNVVTMDVNALFEAAVQVSADNNNVCAGTLVVFTATPVNGGENPEYAWQVNGVQQGGNGPTFTYTPVNGDQVNVVMTSDLPCTQENPVISNTIFMTVNEILPVSVVITADDDAVCAGTPVTLTATPQNGGTATYQWYVNTSPAGANQASFTYTPEDGDMVYVEMTSSLSCAGGNPATSNIIEITTEQEVTPSVTISASTNPVVAGEPVTFTAVPVNGGTDPEYLWFVNGFNVGTGASYTYIPADGDEVYVVMTSSLECVTVMTVVSNTIEVEVITGTEVIKDDLVKVTSYGKNVVITRSGGLKGRVEVIDLTGRLIQERTMHGEDRTEIAIESASGIYMVRVKTTEGLVNAKVLIR
ncbi:Immunoglobulin domain protein [anaerobic digester metagenome]